MLGLEFGAVEGHVPRLRGGVLGGGEGRARTWLLANHFSFEFCVAGIDCLKALHCEIRMPVSALSKIQLKI